MSLIADYHLACPALPLVPVAEAVPEMSLSLDIGQPNQGGLPPFFVRATGDAPDALEAAFTASAFVAEWTRFGVTEGTYEYKLIPTTGMVEQLDDVVADPDRLEALTRNRSIVRRILVTASGWEQTRWFADRAAFDEYREFWADNGVTLAVDRLVHPSDQKRSEDPLTAPQREALRVAHDRGYFEIPRRTSLAEIAEELDISAPSLSERLRRANGRLADAYLSKGDD